MARGMRIGELAKSAGVSTDLVRHYEKLGLLPKAARTQGGYRIYPEAALQRVLLVRNAVACGFTLRELKTILPMRDAGGAPCRQVRDLALEKLGALDEQIQNLKALRKTLQVSVSAWDKKLAATKPGAQARLLEDFPQRKSKEKL